MAPPLSALILALGCFWGANAGPCRPNSSIPTLPASSTSLTVSDVSATSSSVLSSQTLESTSSTATVDTTSDKTDPAWTTTSEQSSTSVSTVSDTTTSEYPSSSSNEVSTSSLTTETVSVSTSDSASQSWSTASESTLTSSTVASDTSTTDNTSSSTSAFSQASSTSDADVTTTTSGAAVASTTTTSEAPATTTEVETRLGFFNGGFEDSTIDGLPWIRGRSVEIKNDPANAHGGSRYALVGFPIPGPGSGRPIYPLRQTVTGIDSTKRYLLTFYWTFTDATSFDGVNCEFFTYVPSLIEGKNLRNPTGPVNQYTRRQLVVGFSAGTTSMDLLFHWKCTSTKSTWTGAEVRIDDISLVEYDPPCTLREAPSQELTCGGIGRFNNPAAESYLIPFSSELIHVDFCAQACASTEGCKTFVHGGFNIASCKLYSATPQELQFVQTGNGIRVNQPECFQCRPLEADD